LTKHELIDAEMHAHARQLLDFCREQKVGFLIAILEPRDDDEKHVIHTTSNLSQSGLQFVAGTLTEEPDDETRHEPGALS
jgi:hypothetical protein